jgi:hypothetical protein
MVARTPNFFIVGAPKSGTTAVYRYLHEHPEIWMPDEKEPHHFAPDLAASKFIADREEYLTLFREAGDAPRVGEASVYYLYSRRAAAEIRSFEPRSRIIVMLRNPVDMIYSLHSQAFYSGYEDLDSFEEALAAEDDRRLGRRIPAHGYFQQSLLYRDIGRYAEQVRRFIDAFGSEQVQVILYDDFERAPADAYRACLEFLGVDPDFRVDFERVNANKRVRSPMLQRLAAGNRGLRRAMRRVFPLFYSRAYQFFYRLNTVETDRPPLEPALRARLSSEFRDDVRELGRLLGRDLSTWMPGRT